MKPRAVVSKAIAKDREIDVMRAWCLRFVGVVFPVRHVRGTDILVRELADDDVLARLLVPRSVIASDVVDDLRVHREFVEVLGRPDQAAVQLVGDNSHADKSAVDSREGPLGVDWSVVTADGLTVVRKQLDVVEIMDFDIE